MRVEMMTPDERRELYQAEQARLAEAITLRLAALGEIAATLQAIDECLREIRRDRFPDLSRLRSWWWPRRHALSAAAEIREYMSTVPGGGGLEGVARDLESGCPRQFATAVRHLEKLDLI